uniref:Candidate secreted effector n=1 Tax=Meloidogyne incognita TaxID=6306 RepID=A0A914L8V0_MELIC
MFKILLFLILLIFIFELVNSDGDFWTEFLTKGSYSYGSDKSMPLDLGVLTGGGGDNNPLAFLFGGGR